MKFTRYQIIAFLFGLGATITIRVVGLLAISDIVSILLIPFLVLQKNMFNNKRFRNVIVLLLFWMSSAIISDIVNETEIKDALKGFFALVPFLGSLLFANWILAKNYKLILPFFWGYSISMILSAGFGFDAFYQESLINNGVNSVFELYYYNKIIIYIIGSFITGVFTIIYFKKSPFFVAIILVIFSFFTLLEGSRSIFLINLLTSIILLYIIKMTNGLPKIGELWQQKLRRKAPVFILVLIAFFFISKNIYEYTVSAGYLGERELIKYEMQKSSKIGLFSGRGEIVASLLAIKDSPILGHGSYARDKKGYGYRAFALTGARDIELDRRSYIQNEIHIPTHSHLWQAWVYNGIIGAIFWLYILFGILYNFIRKYLFYNSDYLAYILLSISGLIWSILFSPFSQKPFLAISIIFFIVLMKNKDNRIKIKPK